MCTYSMFSVELIKKLDDIANKEMIPFEELWVCAIEQGLIRCS